MIKFTVHGTPKGKGRPRVTRYGTYTPKATVEYEKAIRAAFESSGSKAITDNDKPLTAVIRAYFTPPKSWSKKKQAAAIGKPYLHKPDSDNICKSILDALNGIAYADDSQIAFLVGEKWYSNTARVEVTISEQSSTD